MSHAIAAFPNTYEKFARQLREIEIDIESLLRPITRCDLDDCRGTCCHDGVYLGGEESDVIRSLVNENRDEFAEMGLDLPASPIVYGNWRGYTSGPKTVTKPIPMKRLAKDYPEHFPETNCVFLLSDARCGLQVLAHQREKEPWFYKPITCWMHPLSIEESEDGTSRLTLHNEENDPQMYDDYDGFTCRTHCGRTCQGGEPAYRVLKQELELLGRVGGRDLVGEIESYLASRRPNE